MLGRFCTVSKTWNFVASHDTLWKMVFKSFSLNQNLHNFDCKDQKMNVLKNTVLYMRNQYKGFVPIPFRFSKYI